MTTVSSEPLVDTESATSSLRDPLAAILALGGRGRRLGIVVATVGTLLIHGAGAARGLVAMVEIQDFAQQVEGFIADRLSQQLDIEISEPEPEPEPEPKPEPEPEPTPPPPAETPPPQEPPPEAEPPPAPAEAGKILAAEPDDVVDMTDQGFVTGTSDRFAGGVTTSDGTSTTAVQDRNAQSGGVPGGRGTKPAPAAPLKPAQDLSRPARVKGPNRQCRNFPPESDIENINNELVSVLVTIGKDGKPLSVTVLRDPGFGFGREARRCALGVLQYEPALDSWGRPIVGTKKLNIHFQR